MNFLIIGELGKKRFPIRIDLENPTGLLAREKKCI